MSINRVTISGNLTRDPEFRATQSGSSVLSFSVAVNDRRQNAQTGEWEDVPNYVDCTMFGRRAEGLKDYLSKGTKVAIEGKLRWSQWQDRETGKNRSKLEVIVDQIEFLSRRDGAPSYGTQSFGAPQQAPQAMPQQAQYAPQPQVFGAAPQPAAPVAAAPYASAPAPAVEAAAPVQTPPDADVYDEDIPF